MAEEQTTETPTAEPSFDMDAAVSDIASAMGVGEETKEGEESTSAPEGEQSSLQDGTQAPATDSDDPSKTPEKAEAPADANAQQSPSGATTLAPDTWTPEAKAEWAKVPARVQQEIAKREGDITRYVTETKEDVTVGRGFKQVMKPYEGLLAQYNVNAWQHVSSLLKAHTTLMFGQPQDKRTLALAILQDAGIDPTKLASENPQDAILKEDPRVQYLMNRIAQLERGVTGVTSDLQNQRAAETEAEIMAFANDAKAHPHFWEVANQIGSLLKSGMARTLADAYEQAVWANPVTRAKEIARQNGEAQANAERQRKEHLAQARKATAVNVRSRAQASGAAKPSGNWEDGMADTLAEIRQSEART